MEYEAVIGLEIHVETKTKSKMFSSSPVDYQAAPNTLVTPLDLAHPGTLPQVNKQAVENAIRVCHALNMEIDETLHFDRKNYFYSDLPKGFQITQDKRPIGKHGYLDVEVEGNTRRIRINRLHMEEDTAKQLHLVDYTLIDYNRAGIPLVEIVSEPDIRSGKEAAKYVELIREIVTFTDVSDGKMEEGSLRCDVNISIRLKGQSKFGTKVEVKNLNSISNIEKVVEIEIERQKQVIENGGAVIQETRRYDDDLKTTVGMRVKSSAVDYKYFPEPNLVPIFIGRDFIDAVIAKCPELPTTKRQRYANEFNLTQFDIDVLLLDRKVCEFFDEAAKHTTNYKLIANLINSEIAAFLNKNNQKITDLKLSPLNLAKTVDMIASGKISNKQARTILELLFVEDQDPQRVATKLNMVQISDEGAILSLVNAVLDENPSVIDDYKNGKDRAFGFLVGVLMKKSQGKINPSMASKILKEEIEKR